MCGPFAFYAPREAVRATFGVDLPGGWQPPYNVAPSQPVPVIRAPAAGPEGACLRWGLIPSWARDPAIGHRLINARVETIASKPAFRGAFRNRRCVVLATPSPTLRHWAVSRAVNNPAVDEPRHRCRGPAGGTRCTASASVPGPPCTPKAGPSSVTSTSPTQARLARTAVTSRSASAGAAAWATATR